MTVHTSSTAAVLDSQGDLNNANAARPAAEITVEPDYSYRSFALEAHEDDGKIRNQYRPFLLSDRLAADDWVAQLELSTVLKMVQSELFDQKLDRLRILVLYGSLRRR